LESVKDNEINGVKEKEDEKSSKLAKQTIKRRESTLLQNKNSAFGDKSVKDNFSGFHPSKTANYDFPNSASNNNLNNNQINPITSLFNVKSPTNHKSNLNLNTLQISNNLQPNLNGFSDKANLIESHSASPQLHTMSHQNLNSFNYTYKENLNPNSYFSNNNEINKDQSSITNYKIINYPNKELTNNESFENEINENLEFNFANKKILEDNFLESNNIKIAQVACCPNINLKCKYSEIGVMRMNFYDILQEKEDFIRKRTSKVFRSFSHHYNSNDILANNGNSNAINSNNLISSRKKNFINRPSDSSRDNKNKYNNSNNLSNIHANNNPQTNSPIKNTNNNLNPISALAAFNDEEYSGISCRIIKFNIFESINSSFSQDVLNNGREIGKIDGFIFINKIPSIKQIMCGVHTERGLDISANYLTIPNTNANNNFQGSNGAYNNSINNQDLKANLPHELKQINFNCEMLLSKLIQKSSFNFKEISIRDLNMEIVSVLDELVKLLSASSKQNCLFYNFKNEEEIAHAQQILMVLGCNIIHVLDDMVNEQRQLGYKIIELLLDRAELDLANMSLTQYSFWSKSMQEIKNKVCESFINFMLQTLNYTLEKLGRKVTDNNLKNFIEIFLANSYFKIPKVIRFICLNYIV